MTEANRDQIEHWNDTAAVGHWITEQSRYDEMLAPFTDLVVDGARLAGGDAVLDVGCGCGATTRAAARTIAPGRAVGVDLSDPMLERARAVAAEEGIVNVSFERADAQTHAFATAAFDAVISRFGIMFFDDPVAAFTNIRRGTADRGRLAFVCWQPLAVNEWFRVPAAALAQHATPADVGNQSGPGMFAFADPTRPTDVLARAGWQAIDAADRHVPIHVGGRGSVDDAVEFLCVGSLGRTMLAGIDAGSRARAIDALRDALAPHHDGDGVRLDAAVWLVTAEAGAPTR